jgi:hypothetical protein
VHIPECSSSFLRIHTFPTNRRTSLLRHVNVPDGSDSVVCFGRAARQLHPFGIRPALRSARSLILAGVREVLVDASLTKRNGACGGGEDAVLFGIFNR